MYMRIHRSTFHNSWMVEVVQMSINSEWSNKLWYLHTHNGILFSHKEKWSTDTCYRMWHLKNTMLSLSQTTKSTWFYVCELPRIGKSIETESSLELSGTWRKKEAGIHPAVRTGERWWGEPYRWDFQAGGGWWLPLSSLPTPQNHPLWHLSPAPTLWAENNNEEIPAQEGNWHVPLKLTAPT